MDTSGTSQALQRSLRRRLAAPLAIAAVLSLTAMAGVSSAASLQVGKNNKSKGQTTLTSSSKKKAALAISNTGGAAAASFSVKKNKTPFTVNSKTKVKNLNADLLDGLDSSRFQARVGGTCAAGSAIRIINSDGSVVCQPVLTSVPPVPLAWNLNGNAGTNPNTNFLGTTDNQPLVIRTNNAEALRVTAAGAVGIGTSTPTAQLQAVSNSQNAIVGTANGATGDGVQGSSTNGNGVDASGGQTGVSASGGQNGVSTSGTQNGVITNGGQDGVLANGGKDGVESRGTSIGVFGGSDTSIGVLGNSGNSTNAGGTRGVVGTLNGGSCPGVYAVGGCSGANDAVVGSSDTGIGMLANSGTPGNAGTRGLVGTLNTGSCPDQVGNGYAVGGCGGNATNGGTGVEAISGNDGVFAISHHGSGGNTAAAVRAVNDSGGDIFIGQNSATNHVFRVDSNGKGFFDGGTQTGGADYAESIHAVNRSQLHPGDVLSIAPSHGYSVAKSTRPYSSLVVGVYSTKPAVLAVGSQGVDASLSGQVPVAMMGVVPTKVTVAGGAIRPGDLLTTSRVPGYAMKAKATMVHGIAIYPQGTIVGKALESLSHGQGVIEIMLMSR